MSAYQDTGLPLADAAKQLDISPELLRKRIYRGLVKGYKVGGRWYVVLNGLVPDLDASQDSHQDGSGQHQDKQDNRDKLYETLLEGQRSEITFLRNEMARQREQCAEEARRKDLIIHELTTKLKALPATTVQPQVTSEPAASASPASSRPWWKFWVSG